MSITQRAPVLHNNDVQDVQDVQDVTQQRCARCTLPYDCELGSTDAALLERAGGGVALVVGVVELHVDGAGEGGAVGRRL